jgi:hypothetical protein
MDVLSVGKISLFFMAHHDFWKHGSLKHIKTIEILKFPCLRYFPLLSHSQCPLNGSFIYFCPENMTLFWSCLDQKRRAGEMLGTSFNEEITILKTLGL